MAIPGSILGPAVGAFISGLIGVATVEYRNYREEIAEVERWYDQAIRLAEQVKRETPESYLADIQGKTRLTKLANGRMIWQRFTAGSGTNYEIT